MSDISLSVLVSRTLLGLSALQVNDATNYQIATMLGSLVPFDRVTAGSPWVDGDTTVFRRRPNVAEQFVIEIRASTTAALHASAAALIAAFIQDNFTLTVAIAGTTHVYACEAADYQVKWDGPREIAKQLQVTLSVPRQPVPVSGGY